MFELESEDAAVGLATAERDDEAEAEADAEVDAEVVEAAADVLVAVLDVPALFDAVAVPVVVGLVGFEVAEADAELPLPLPGAAALKRSPEVSTNSPLRTSGCVSQPTLPTWTTIHGQLHVISTPAPTTYHCQESRSLLDSANKWHSLRLRPRTHCCSWCSKCKGSGRSFVRQQLRRQ